MRKKLEKRDHSSSNILVVLFVFGVFKAPNLLPNKFQTNHEIIRYLPALCLEFRYLLERFDSISSGCVEVQMFSLLR